MPTINNPYEQTNAAPPVKYNPITYNPNQVFQQNGQQVTNWYDYAQQQVQNYGNQIFDFNSPLYQSFGAYLQKLYPGVGVNTLMSPLLASGASTTSAGNIAKVNANDILQKKNAAIKQTVEEFALGNYSQIPGLLGQFSSNLQNQQNVTLQNDLRSDQNSPLSGLGSLLGQLAGLGLGGAFGKLFTPATAGGGV